MPAFLFVEFSFSVMVLVFTFFHHFSLCFVSLSLSLSIYLCFVVAFCTWTSLSMWLIFSLYPFLFVLFSVLPLVSFLSLSVS